MNNGRPLSSYISRETSLRIQPRQWQQQKLKSKQHTSSTSCYTNSNVDLSMCFRGLYVRSIETIAIEQSSSLLSLSNNPILPSVVIDAIDVATNSDSILHKHLGTIKHNSHNSNPSKLDVISDTIYFDVIIDPVVPFIFKLDEDYRSKIEYTLLNFPYWKDMGCTLNRSGNGAFNIHIARQYEAINTSLQTVAKLKHLQLRLTFSQINNNGNNHQRELTSEMLGDIVGYTLKQVISKLWIKRYPLIFCPINTKRIAMQHNSIPSIVGVFTRMIQQNVQFGTKCLQIVDQPWLTMRINNQTDELEKYLSKSLLSIAHYGTRQPLSCFLSRIADNYQNSQRQSDTELSLWSTTTDEWTDTDSNSNDTSIKSSTISTMDTNYIDAWTDSDDYFTSDSTDS